MSLRGNKGVGIPTVLLHEGEGLVVTVETKSGYLYRGTMDSVEDSMNTGLKEVTVTDPAGAVSRLERVYLRGSQVLYVIFPDVLKMAPMFERLRKAALGLSVAGGLGRGRQQAIEAKGASRPPRLPLPFRCARRRGSTSTRRFLLSSPHHASHPLPRAQRPRHAAPQGAAGHCQQPPPRRWPARRGRR